MVNIKFYGFVGVRKFSKMVNIKFFGFVGVRKFVFVGVRKFVLDLWMSANWQIFVSKYDLLSLPKYHY